MRGNNIRLPSPNALRFVRSHVAAAGVLLVWTRNATLVGLQQVALTVRASARITRINRRAAGKQSHGLCRSAIVPQRAVTTLRVSIR